jgi:hypothetical protein
MAGDWLGCKLFLRRGVEISIVRLGPTILEYNKDKIGIHFDADKVDLTS